MMQVLSKSKAGIIKSLSIKKYRELHKLFLVEGHKIIGEVLQAGMEIKYLVGNAEDIENIDIPDSLKYEADIIEMNKLSSFKNPSSIMAVVVMPERELKMSDFDNSLSMALDTVQDPGNFGTILRICDWYGIKNVICSKLSTDLYNPKVIQSTMGAFLRVNVFYEDLSTFIPSYCESTKLDCFGTFLGGDNIYKCNLPQNGLIVMGNEGNGISPEVEEKVTKKLFIPPYSSNHVESLNISIAAAIVCNEFRRNSIK